MRVRLRFFASLRDLSGVSDMELELPSGSTIQDLRSQLSLDLPSIGAALETVAYAMDDDFVPLQRELVEGSEIALIPPVSGGQK